MTMRCELRAHLVATPCVELDGQERVHPIVVQHVVSQHGDLAAAVSVKTMRTFLSVERARWRFVVGRGGR
jgi:hypothetical protein